MSDIKLQLCEPRPESRKRIHKNSEHLFFIPAYMYPACSLQRRTLRQPVLDFILHQVYIRSRFAATVVVGESVGGYVRGK